VKGRLNRAGYRCCVAALAVVGVMLVVLASTVFSVNRISRLDGVGARYELGPMAHKPEQCRSGLLSNVCIRHWSRFGFGKADLAGVLRDEKARTLIMWSALPALITLLWLSRGRLHDVGFGDVGLLLIPILSIGILLFLLARTSLPVPNEFGEVPDSGIRWRRKTKRA
jgi:Protein of unknown function (DUF805)